MFFNDNRSPLKIKDEPVRLHAGINSKMLRKGAAAMAGFTAEIIVARFACREQTLLGMLRQTCSRKVSDSSPTHICTTHIFATSLRWPDLLAPLLLGFREKLGYRLGQALTKRKKQRHQNVDVLGLSRESWL